jgi:hypothetical protein
MDLDEQRLILESLIVSRASYREILKQSQLVDRLIVKIIKGGK